MAILTAASLESVVHLLEAGGWTVSDVRESVRKWAPPRTRAFSRFASVFLPTTEDVPGAAQAIEGALRSLAADFHVPVPEVLAELRRQYPGSVVEEDSQCVWSIRLRGTLFDRGSAPLGAFDHAWQSIRRLLSDAATFVVTDDPRTPRKAKEAGSYLDMCRFLQTQSGSFVTRIGLPVSGMLREQGSLFDSHRLTASEVNRTVRGAVTHVIRDVAAGSVRGFTDSLLERNRDYVSVGMLTDVRDLLASAGVHAIDFSFEQAGESEVVTTAPYR